MQNHTFSPTWIELFKVGHYGDGFTITASDLTSIQRNFQNEGKPIPVGIGLNWSGSPLHGSIDQLKIQGGTLLGRLNGITPSMDEILSKSENGMPKCRWASLAKSKDGSILKRIGFSNEPTYATGKSHAVKQDFQGNKEIEFFEMASSDRFIPFTENVGFSHACNAQLGDREISRLKAQGSWSPMFDRFRIDHIFSLLDGNPAHISFGEGAGRHEGSLVECFAYFLEQIVPGVQSAGSPTGVLTKDVKLAGIAQRLSRERGLSYSEALDLAIEHQRIDLELTSYAEHDGAIRDQDIHVQALTIVRNTGVSYSVALDRVIDR